MKQASNFDTKLEILSESFEAHFELIETRLLPKDEMARKVLVKKVIQAHSDKLSDSDKAAFKAAPTILAHRRCMQRNNSPSSITHRVERVLQSLENFTKFLETDRLVDLLMGGVHCTFTVDTIVPASKLENRGH